MMRVTFLALGSFLALAPLTAQAAGPFDGNWTGSANGSTSGGFAQGSCVATLTATIKDNRLTGTEIQGRSTIKLSGSIASDGSFKSSGGGFIGKFSGASFEGSFVSQPNSSCRNWHVTMSRAK